MATLAGFAASQSCEGEAVDCSSRGGRDGARDGCGVVCNGGAGDFGLLSADGQVHTGEGALGAVGVQVERGGGSRWRGRG